MVPIFFPQVHKHKDEKHKKEDKSVTHVLKALNSLNTTEEKLAALCKKYADMFDENRKLQVSTSPSHRFFRRHLESKVSKFKKKKNTQFTRHTPTRN